MDDVEIWIYGSRARGDADALSDTDVLVVADPGTDVDARLVELSYPRIAVSRYSWAEMEAMWSYGSLYLHHLRREGRRLRPAPRDPERLAKLIANVPRFTRAREDLDRFQQAVREAERSLAAGGWPDFECEVIATVVRHAAILGAYCAGEPVFGRELPFEVAGKALGYDAETVNRLVEPATAWRKHLPSRRSDDAAIVAWIARVWAFLEDLEPLIDEYRALLPVAA
jgi:predicted nucleotidyltransferase